MTVAMFTMAVTPVPPARSPVQTCFYSLACIPKVLVPCKSSYRELLWRAMTLLWTGALIARGLTTADSFSGQHVGTIQCNLRIPKSLSCAKFQAGMPMSCCKMLA